MPRWKKFLLALLAVVATGAITAAAWFTWSYLHTCDGDVKEIDGQCIGVADDGYDFDNPEIRKVVDAIAEENKHAAKKPYVTVAMMLPLEAGKDEPGLRRQMRSDIQGAYLGQRKVNAEEGRLPRIKLVLANPGRDYEHYGPVVDALVEMAHSPDHKLRAVTGFNLSLDATEKAMRQLTKEHHIPVLASRLSGDGIANSEKTEGYANQKFPGLARIIPTNYDAAQALADFNKQHRNRRDRDTVVVYDQRPDVYAASLKSAFESIDETGPPGPDGMAFHSPGITKVGQLGNDFNEIAHNICDSGAHTVYFAGRTKHLKLFAQTLSQVGCKDQHYTVISGSDAASLEQSMSEDDWAQLRGADSKAKVSVQYAAPGHPDAWRTELKARDGERPQYLTEPAEAVESLKKQIEEESADLGSTTRLEDSRTMLVYDGLLTIGEALRKAQGPDEKAAPRLEDIGTKWSRFNLRYRIKGTSGLICLTTSGNPYDKPVSVVELDPGKEGSGTLKFLGIGWPEGEPQEKNCRIPSDR